MSRAFIKEQDVEAFEDLPDRQISELPNDVTIEGMALIEEALAASRMAYAVAQASNDHAAMAAASRDLRYWNARHATAHIVGRSDDTTHVRFGSAATILRDDGREQTFRIVGEDEADPLQGTISHGSPLARALLGKRVGDTVKAGNGDVVIRNIQ